MKKIIPFLISIILILNCNAHITSDPCNFKFALFSTAGVGWGAGDYIKITVDEIDYGLVYLPFGLGNDSAEVIVSLPSGEMQLVWIGNFAPIYYFEIYNPSDELIYTSPEFLPAGGLFFTYQNECPNCPPLTDFKGVYIQEENHVNLSWKAPETTALLGFDIFRNDVLIDHVAPTIIFYSDSTANLESGNYKYCVIPVYPFECDLDDKCFETPINVGIKNYEDHITIYPNPANNLINISGDMVLEVKIYNNIGQLIINKYNTNIIDASKLTNGIYIVSIETTTGNIQKKIIINH
jgi:hypothetical protein